MFLRLTIVRKIDAGDGRYPLINTCVHYLKVNILLETNVTSHLIWNLVKYLTTCVSSCPTFKQKCPEREAVGCNCRKRIPRELKVFHCKENSFKRTGNETENVRMNPRLVALSSILGSIPMLFYTCPSEWCSAVADENLWLKFNRK